MRAKLEDELKKQIELVKESANLINTLKDSVKFKDEQIKTLELTLKLKEEQLKAISTSSVDKQILEEKGNQIEDLQQKLEFLQSELAKADKDLEQLELENKKLRKNTSNDLIIDFTDYEVSKAEIIEKMRNILQKALRTVTISVPLITDLQDLYLYDVKSSVSMQIYTQINQGIKEHAELLDEFESLDNISLRASEGGDRYVIMKDGDELLFVVNGNGENNHLCFHTRDKVHINFFKGLVLEGWLRSRKVSS